MKYEIKNQRTLLSALILVSVTGCTIHTQDLDITKPYYIDKGLSSEKKLEFPPDLSIEVANALNSPSTDQLESIDTLKIKYGLLGTVQELQLSFNRKENDTWVELKTTADTLIPRIKTFFSNEGLQSKTINVLTGSIITDWVENLNRNYPQGVSDSFQDISDWLQGSHRDRYLVSLQPATKAGFIELRLFHESLLLTETNEQVRWLPIPPNEFYRLDMLKRLLQYLTNSSLSSELQQNLRVTGLEGPFQFVQNEYAESYLVIPDTPARVITYMKNALQEQKTTLSVVDKDTYALLTLTPCVAVLDDASQSISVCHLKIAYSLSNSIVVATDKDEKNLAISASRNFFRSIAQLVIHQSTKN
ncbi:MAG: outer membrane protein assembly factor BamC [Methylacidiphilales bacterium]|nr:outer membrane protein assembly factor BamC [Candidatus Methylacidiphilales bacterium]